MTENVSEAKNVNLTCESCGKEFSCGLNAGKCWCFEIDLSSETLAELKDKYENCLCQECLNKGSKNYN